MSDETFFDALVLGIIQGVTEFLPVSSDGHLVIAQGYLRSFNAQSMTFDVMLHLGTLLAVVCYFRHDVRTLLFFMVGKKVENNPFPVRSWFWLILAATVPTGIIGLALEKSVEPLFNSPVFTGGALVLNGVLLLSTGLAPKAVRGAADVTVRDALLIGFMQGFAVLPGISRSSNTIATAMFLRLHGETAAKFSFLISIPAVVGAVLVRSRDLQGIDWVDLLPFGIGAGAALLTGICAIAILLRAIIKGKFQYFGYYCLALGGTVLGLAYWGY